MALTWEEQNRADFDGFVHQHQTDTGEQLTARRAQVIDAMALLEGYAHRSKAQDEQLGQLIAEDAALSKLARTVIGTSNVWEGVTSQGTTANWYAEAAVVTDTTPAIAQVAITPYRESVWITGSLEVLDDTTLDDQVPALIDEARFRLEATAFATGTGSTQPFGLTTRGASYATTGALSAAQIYGLLQNLPPRFRVYDSAKPVWMANVSILNAARQLPAFAGAVNSIVSDNTDDGIPEMLGIDFMESSATSALNTVGAKNLLLGDMSQYIIVDRQPNVLIFEPLFKDQATGRPAGQRGWFSYARVGADTTTPAAAYGSNAFVYHTV
jgi:HK97 family phage major capsid protein